METGCFKTGFDYSIWNIQLAKAGPAQEAAYAIWNLTVGHEGNSAGTLVNLFDQCSKLWM